MSHEFDIYQQLTRIADSLEKIERKLPEQPILTANEMRENNQVKTCSRCIYEDCDGFQEPCVSCDDDYSGYIGKEKTDE